MRSLLTIILLLLPLLPSSAQDDRRDVRRGNRQFRKENYRAAEIDYRKAVLKDSTSLKAQYNLASALYREQDYDSAAKALETVGEAGEGSSDYHFNAGDIALARQDYQAAVEYFRQSLLLNPSDLEAKENYTYAKKMLENRQNQGSGQQNQNQQDQQDQQNQQNQDQQDQQNQQNQQNQQDQQNQIQDRQDNDQQDGQDQRQDGGDGRSQDAPSGISRQQASQMLRAIQAKEDETQEKVKREKARLLESSQKEKNW